MSAARSNPMPLVAVAVLVFVAFAFYGRSTQQTGLQQAEQATRAVPLGVQAPNITMFDRSETPTPLESYRGRFVFVNFWATWCGPCIAELPSLIALRGRLDPAEIAFVSIAEDDTWPPVDAFLQKQPLPFDLFRDRPPRVENHFEVGSYPASFLIDPNGRALYRFNGARDWNAPEVLDLFARAGVRSAAD